MTFDVTLLLAAFAGGLFGAAIGTLPAFIFTGFTVIAGVAVAAAGGGDDILTKVAFGPVFGPHIAFGGGAAATAYAYGKGLLPSGRDVTPALAGLNRPDVLLVGGLFGAGAYLFEAALGAAGLRGWTDSIALTVVVSAIVARLAFGSAGLFGATGDGGSRFQPTADESWVPWQQTGAQLLTIGLGAGLLSAWMALELGADRGGAVLGFGIAAATLIFAQIGAQVPVTHHIALPAAAAALASGNLYVGAAGGIAGAAFGELWSRVFLLHGDTHIDPPAAAIATMIAVISVAAAFL